MLWFRGHRKNWSENLVYDVSKGIKISQVRCLLVLLNLITTLRWPRCCYREPCAGTVLILLTFCNFTLHDLIVMNLTFDNPILTFRDPNDLFKEFKESSDIYITLTRLHIKSVECFLRVIKIPQSSSMPILHHTN